MLKSYSSWCSSRLTPYSVDSLHAIKIEKGFLLIWALKSTKKKNKDFLFQSIIPFRKGKHQKIRHDSSLDLIMQILKIKNSFLHYKDFGWNRDGLMVPFHKISLGLASRMFNLVIYISSSSPPMATNHQWCPHHMLHLKSNLVLVQILSFLTCGGLFLR